MKKIYSFSLALILIIAFLSGCNHRSSDSTSQTLTDSIKAEPPLNLDSLIDVLGKRDSIDQAFLQSSNLTYRTSKDSIVYMNVIRMKYKKSLRKSEPYTDTIVYIREASLKNDDSYTPDFTSTFGNFNGNNICGEYSDSGWRTIDEAAEACENREEYCGESFLEEKIIVKTDSCLIAYCIDKPMLASKNFIYITYRDKSANRDLKYCCFQVGEGVFDQTFCQFRVIMKKHKLVVYEGNKAIFKKRFKTYGR